MQRKKRNKLLKSKLLIINRNLLLEDYFLHLAVIKAYAKNTIKIYYDISDAFMHFLYLEDLKTISELTTILINKFLIEKKIHISSRTLNLYISSLNNFLKFICNNLSECCELKKIRHSKFLKKLPNIMEADELVKLFKELVPKTNNWVELRTYAMAALLYSSGMRISEAINIEATDFIENEWIRIDNTKNMIARVVPVNEFALEAIYRYKQFCPFKKTTIFWSSIFGKKLNISAASKAIAKMFSFYPHYFRHCFATHLYYNKCDLLILKEFLGHSSISTTSLYIHTKPQHLQATVENCHPINKNIYSD